MKKRILFVPALCCFFALGVFSTTSAVVCVSKNPPAKKVVVRSAKPYKNAVWVSGHWRVRKGNYFWVAGKWQKDRPGFKWIDGHWKKTAKGWIWIKGHWARR